jgi:hypothetical protein
MKIHGLTVRSHIGNPVIHHNFCLTVRLIETHEQGFAHQLSSYQRIGVSVLFLSDFVGAAVANPVCLVSKTLQTYCSSAGFISNWHNSRGRINLVKTIVVQLGKKFPALYGQLRVITEFK